jgi:hypothetical protein
MMFWLKINIQKYTKINHKNMNKKILLIKNKMNHVLSFKINHKKSQIIFKMRSMNNISFN